ncbi:26S proteasome non-ATPase regulatory subunit 5 [Sitodiplosis mosellana]|uniref:26S proteasome non-ATPase regulatory subunit 5 n=1 Tax=Sitodiplosis mosellana TaxID=263140 RepID=UPI002443CFE4|nr:26S proteasome non-ATPase regulatory subunit 5 [Sitodiplosis mosellana]
MSEEWCIEQLAKLQIKESRLDTLNEIRAALSNVGANEVNVSAQFLALLDSIDDYRDSPEQCQVTCDILSMCMSNLNIDHTEKVSYCDYLEKCLLHKNDDVKVLALNYIERQLKDVSGNELPVSMNNLYQSNMMIALVNCLECEGTGVATTATTILLKLLPKAINDKSIKNRLEHILCGKDLVRCRVYELGVKLSQASVKNQEKFNFILEKLVADLDTDDILLKLNILYLTSDLAQTDYGHIYMENKAVFTKVLREIELLDENPFKSILVPGYLKFFGQIATVQPAKIIQGFSGMINSLFDCILDENVSALPVAFDTFGHLGRSAEGKMLLDECHSARMHEVLNDIGKSIYNLPTPLKVRALNALETLFQCDEANASNNQISSITEQWFKSLTGTNQLTFVQEFCRNPFSEIKTAALALLRSICVYAWGQRALSNTAGFIEYLLDRNSEVNKDVLHEKYSIIRTIANSREFDENTSRQINQYVKDGVFYIQGQMEVAIEGS